MPAKPPIVIADDNKTPTTAVQNPTTENWHQPVGAEDGTIATMGAMDDAAVTNPTLSASEIALLKGLMKQLQGTGTGAAPVSITGRSVVGAAEALTVNATVGGVPLAVIPADATGAMMTLEGGDIRALWTGGAPTAAVGHLVVYGDTIQLMNRADLLAFRAIRTGTTDGSLTITYYK